MTKAMRFPHTIETIDWISRLPPVLQQRAMLCAKQRAVSVELAAMVGLAAIATAIGKGLQVKSGRERYTRGNLFILLGTPSGVGKSEVFRDMLKPILDFETSLHAWWEQEPAVRARAGEELLKAQISGLRSVIRKYPGGNLQIFRSFQVAQRKRVICAKYLESPSLLADDSTSEALVELMGRSHEAIATVSADARFSLKRLGSTNSREESFFLKGYSGDLTLSSRITRRASRLRSPCLTVLYLTQRDSYRSFIDNAQVTRSGLLPRFLHREIMSNPASGAGEVDLRRSNTIRRDYEDVLHNLIEAYRFEEDTAIVNPCKGAADFLGKLEGECRLESETDESIHGEVIRRRAEQSWRVALCLHAVRHGILSGVKHLSLQDAETAHRVVGLMTRFFE